MLAVIFVVNEELGGGGLDFHSDHPGTSNDSKTNLQTLILKDIQSLELASLVLIS